MNLKNYTSEVAASKSMDKIERCLVQAGATDISKKYTDGVCSAITFRMMINQMPVFFKLPARVDTCFNVLWKEYKRPMKGTKEKVKLQAERTAWKIVCDWVEVQLTMIKLEQAEPLQVFLPYVYNPVKDETLFEKIKNNDFKLLTN